jgi:hypothetical protein
LSAQGAIQQLRQEASVFNLLSVGVTLSVQALTSAAMTDVSCITPANLLNENGLSKHIGHFMIAA